MKRLKFLLVFLTVFSVLFVTVSAKTISTSYSISGASKSGSTLTIDDGADALKISAEIDSGYLGELESAGGKLSITVPLNIVGGTVHYQISVSSGGSTLVRTSGLSATVEVSASQVASGVEVTIVALGISKESVQSATLSNLSISCTPNATATPDATATPTHSATPTASTSASASPKATPNTTATAKPNSNGNGSGYERTNDPYDGSKRVTNPPPSMSGDLDINENDIATQAPDEPTSAPENVSTKINTDPTFGLILLFVILFLFLAVDIVIIIWRKKLGFWQLINGGVAKRKVAENLCDNPEDFIEEGAVEQQFMNDGTPKTDNNFDNDLSK